MTIDAKYMTWYYLEERGDIIKMTKDTRRRFTFRIPDDLYAAVRHKAEEQGVPINAQILQILWDWLQ